MKKKILVWEPFFFMFFGVFHLHNNYWWRWIYIFGGSYILFDLFAIAVGLDFWNNLLLIMYDVNSPYWNIIWSFFVMLGAFVFVLGIKLLLKRKKLKSNL